MRSTHLLTAFAIMTPGLLAAGPRASANYTVRTDTADGGGARATSAAYTNVGTTTVGGTPAKISERYTGRIQGAIAAGTAQVAIEWVNEGTTWSCSTELQTWTATLT